MKLSVLMIFLFLLTPNLIQGIDKKEKKNVNLKEQKEFEKSDSVKWQEVFTDSCTEDWKKKWFLDGEIGTVKSGKKGMTLTAGPEYRNDAGANKSESNGHGTLRATSCIHLGPCPCVACQNRPGRATYG